MKVHELKILPVYFEQVKNELKNFEIRLNDRDFKTYEYVVLKEWDTVIQEYSGRFVIKMIGYVTSYAQKEDYIVFGILGISGELFHEIKTKVNL